MLYGVIIWWSMMLYDVIWYYMYDIWCYMILWPWDVDIVFWCCLHGQEQINAKKAEPQQCHCHAEAGQKGTTWNNTQLDIDGAGHRKWNSQVKYYALSDDQKEKCETQISAWPCLPCGSWVTTHTWNSILQRWFLDTSGDAHRCPHLQYSSTVI